MFQLIVIFSPVRTLQSELRNSEPSIEYVASLIEPIHESRRSDIVRLILRRVEQHPDVLGKHLLQKALHPC